MASLTLDEIMQRLESQGDAAAVAGMARYGIAAPKVYGVKIPVLRALAREAGRDHELAARWNGRDALRELTSEKIQVMLRARENRART